MLLTNSWSLTAFALIPLATLAMGLDEMDLKKQRGRPKPLDENLVLRHPDPDPSTRDRIETVDSQDLTTSLQNVVGSPSVTLPPVATGSTVHTGGVGGSPTTATAPTTTSGVLGPNTTGSVPSGGNVVPDTSSASASASGSGGNAGTQAATTTTSAGVSGASVAASTSAGVSMSASTTMSETASVSSSSTATANQAGPSQLQSQGDNVCVGGVLGVVIVGIGWLL